MHTTYRLVDVRPTDPADLRRLSPVVEEAVAQTVVRSGIPALVVRRQDPYMLLGPQDRRLPMLAQAIGWLADQGLPVFFRVGGGSAVLLDEGCLSFAVIRPCRDLTQWRQNFHDLTAGVLRGLSALGVAAHFGQADGAYCPGPFDLVTDAGRKIAGVAQAIRGGFAMVGGMLLVHQDAEHATGLVQDFYRRAGRQVAYRADAVARLDAIVPVDIDRVQDAIITGFGQISRLQASTVTPTEQTLARDLYTLRAAVRALSAGSPPPRGVVHPSSFS